MAIQLAKDRSFRFELVNTKTGIIQEHFNLIYPPESYSIKEAPRHGIMKLFSSDGDNLYIDDFGDDNKIIKLRGTTGAPKTRAGYKDSSFQRFTGQEAILEFRNKIINWREDIKKKRKSLNDFVVVLINLFDEEQYEVFITNFQMEKSANKPMFYVYNIEMITVPQVFKQKKFDTDYYKDTVRKVKDAMDTIKDAEIILENTLTDNIVVNGIRDVRSLFDETLVLSRRVQGLLGIDTGFGTSLPNIIAESLEDISTILTDYGTIIQEWVDVFTGDPKNTFHPWLRAAKDVEREWKKVTNFKKYFHYQKEQVGMKSGVTFEEYLTEGQSQNETVLREIVKQSAGKTVYEIARLAREQFGVDLSGPDIAKINNMTSMDVQSGEKVYIPVSENVIVDFDNRVITDDRANDYLGKDIKLVDGKFQGNSAGDLLTIEDIENMKQVVTNILNTEFNAFITLDNYGFDAKHTIGKASAGDFLKTVKIKYRSALVRDPRIVDVVDTMLSVNKGKVTINGTIVLPIGRFESSYNL